ncbi:MAG: response regulator [Desulfobacterales bacterium]|nr:response regulator [Desulfobacterales bacterium]
MDKRILVVEDETDMRIFMSALLETSGFKPVIAKNGNDGLARARQEKPDLIILDVMMPEAGGAATYQKLKNEEGLKDIPVIMISAVAQRTFFHYISMLNTQSGSPLPLPEAYIEKPPEPQRVINTIKNLLFQGVVSENTFDNGAS